MLRIEKDKKPSYWNEDSPLWQAVKNNCARAYIHLLEKKLLKKNISTMPSVWGSSYRYVQSGPLAGSLWSKTLTPYLPDIIDCTVLPTVRRVNLCKAPQVGGSVCIETLIGYHADMRPGPCKVIYPDQQTARKNCRDRLGEMFLTSPRLAEQFTSVKQRITDTYIKLPHMNIGMGWAGSVTSLGNDTIQYLYLDEIDKYRRRNSRETSAEALAEKRVTAYPYDHLIFKLSTPTVESGQIWQNLLASTIFLFRAVCPYCHKAQVMIFNYGETFMKENDGFYYKCINCAKLWNDSARDSAVMDGYWTHGEYDKEARRWIDKGKRKQNVLNYIKKNQFENIGFHVPAWLSPFVSFRQIITKYLESQGDINSSRDFCNNFKAEPFSLEAKKKNIDFLIQLKDTRKRGEVPDIVKHNIVALTAAVDTQDNGFFFEIRAWSKNGLTSWCVMEDFIRFDRELLLTRLFRTDYIDCNGEVLPVSLAAIDSGGHKTAEVYDLCRGEFRGRLIPLKGMRKAAMPYKPNVIEFYPGTTAKIPNGVTLWSIDTTYYKNLLSSRLGLKIEEQGACLFHSEISEAWLKMLTVEVQDEKGFWTLSFNQPNHYFDILTYQYFCADLLGLKYGYTKKAEEKVIKKKKELTRGKEVRKRKPLVSPW